MDKTIIDAGTREWLTMNRFAYGLATAIPGIVKAFDPATNLVTVQPAIAMKTIVNGKAVFVPLPAVACVPLCLPHSAAAGLFITVPIAVGDLGMMIFSQRSIDNVVQFGVPSGTPQPPLTASDPAMSEDRHHDLTDAMFIPNLLTVPTAIGGWCQDGIQIRNTAGTVSVTVKADATYILGNVNMTGNITLTGNMTATGEITAAEGGANIDLSGHKHANGGGIGNSGGPVA